MLATETSWSTPLGAKEHRDRSWSHDSTLSDASTAGVVDAPAQKVDLSLLHACLHCRASKTACTDCRPCARCTRLGLECQSYIDKPRKRACVSCHTNKVACDLHLASDDSCSRCKRLGNKCVPREQTRQRGPYETSRISSVTQKTRTKFGNDPR